MGKIVFKPWGINCCLKVTHFPVPCLWCVHEIWDLNDSGFWSGRKQSERTGGYNNHQNWGIVQGLWSLDAQTRRQKWDRHCFWKLACSLFEIFPQSNSPPTNRHNLPASNPRKNQKTKPIKETTPHTLHTHTNPQTTNNSTKNPNTQRVFKSSHKFVTICCMGRDGVFKVKCVFTILKLIIFPFLTANIINQFIHSITIKCMHWQEINEHTLIIAIIIMTQIQQSN